MSPQKLDELLDEWYEYYRNEYSDYQKLEKTSTIKYESQKRADIPASGRKS